MTKALCIYHGNCADGFGAAWAVRKGLGDQVEFHAGVYQEPPPDTAGRHVILVDFSYKRPVLIEMAKRAQSVLILDHHKSAADDLVGFEKPYPNDWGGHLIRANQVFVETCETLIAAEFDMNRSGAAMAWDYFNADERPGLIEHIQDRDLWRFALPFTREIQAAVFSYPYDFEVWDRLAQTPLRTLAMEGASIERKHHKDVAELVAAFRRRMTIGGFDVPVANLPYTLTSDAGHLMAQGEPFAACYWDTPRGRVFSLRSIDGGMDVAEIAKQYGGGGHKNASGFTVSYEAARAMELSA